MARLTSQQIEQLLATAALEGLSPAEIDGFRLALLARAAQPGLGDKLAISIDMMPDEQADSVRVFMDDVTAVRMDVMQRGHTDLLSMSDDEWAAIMGDGA